MFGLLERDIEYIRLALSRFNEVENAVIFGSRAIGNYKKGSDVDISITGSQITQKTLCQLDDLLNEEYPLPYFFDLIYYDDIHNQNLKQHIDKYGKEIYQKK